MLPNTYFDRLTHALGIKTDARAGERRRAIRIPASFRPDVFPIQTGILLSPQQARARDISTDGISLIIPASLVPAKAVALSLKPRGAEESFGLLCMLRRTVKLDTTWTLGGYTFEQMLRPGQEFAAEQRIVSLDLIDVSGGREAEDPGALAAPAPFAILPSQRAAG